MLQFIRSELETGMTFASLALNSESDGKRQRNQQNARKAYDSAQHFLEEHIAREKTTKQTDLLEGLTQLKNLLTGLGEKFDE